MSIVQDSCLIYIASNYKFYRNPSIALVNAFISYLFTIIKLADIRA